MSADDDGLSDEDAKDLYAHAGVALFKAQVLEESLIVSMMVARFPERDRLTRKDIDAFTEGLSTRTLGALIREYKRWTTVPATVEAQLAEALKHRNMLAHHYFKEHATDWYTPDGVIRMRDALLAMQRAFDGAIEQLDDLIEPMMTAQGITRETLDQKMASMLTQARAEAANVPT